jgi:hypothetical protein
MERQGALGRRQAGDDLDSFREYPAGEKTGVPRFAAIIEFHDADGSAPKGAVRLGYGEQKSVALVAA